jgi:hypothetical protein
MKRWLVVAVAVAALVSAAPGGTAVGAATLRLVIVHVFEHCHVWTVAPSQLGAYRTLGASARLSVRPRTRVVIRSDCPMDFDFSQTGGPRLHLGDPRTYAGTSRVIVFTKPGVYRLTATNAQTPEERGLTVLGEPNTLKLTVTVKR